MGLSMPSPTPIGKNFYLRLRPPADVAAKVSGKTINVPVDGKPRMVTVKEFVKVSLGTADPREAKRLFTEAHAALEVYWETVRRGPQMLSQKQLVAVAGEIRNAFVNAFDENPGSPERWLHVLDTNASARVGRLNPFTIPTSGRKAMDMEGRFGGMMDAVLSGQGIMLHPEQRPKLLTLVADALDDAATTNLRKAEGDYSPDTAAAKYPKLDTGPRSTPRKGGVRVTFTEMFEYWKRKHLAEGKAQKTADEYETKTNAFVKWLAADERLVDDDAEAITPKHVQDYLDHLLHERGLSSKTVADKYLVHISAVFRAGLVTFELSSNPAGPVVFKASKPKRTRGPGYTEAEARAILSAANLAMKADGGMSQEIRLSCRWIPWLCAYTGARVTEMAQLRKQDVYQEHGVWLINVTPDAGSVKTGEFRLVPIHPHLVEQGFIDFVKSRPDGPLFYRTKDAKERRGVKSSQAENVGKAVWRWLTSLPDMSDLGVQPNHAWRHRLKTVGRDAAIDLHYLDMIQGHSNGRAATGYGETTIKALAREMQKIPVIKVG